MEDSKLSKSEGRFAGPRSPCLMRTSTIAKLDGQRKEEGKRTKTNKKREKKRKNKFEEEFGIKRTANFLGLIGANLNKQRGKL
jgi:hypothetical protein